jgi:DNA-binding MarR family transcriptional regulator
LSLKFLRNLCYIGIARYVGEVFEHDHRVVLRGIAKNVIEKSDFALFIMIKSSNYRLKAIELKQIEKKMNRFLKIVGEQEFSSIEMIGLSIALLDDMSKELEKIGSVNRLNAMNDLISALFVLNKYFDRKFERSECYDKAIQLTNVMESIWEH